MVVKFPTYLLVILPNTTVYFGREVVSLNSVTYSIHISVLPADIHNNMQLNML